MFPRFIFPGLFSLLLLGFPGGLAAQNSFQLISPDFSQGGRMPARLAKDFGNASPTLKIAGTPKGTQSLALIVDDPDAPSGTFTHWLVWNISPETRELRGGAAPPGTVGRNDFGDSAYTGPSPPSGEHRYFFRLYALNQRLGLPEGATRDAVEKALHGHIIATATLMGKYAKGADE